MADIYAQLRYLLSKHSEIKSCFEDSEGYSKLSKIKVSDKTVLITEDKNQWKWYALRHLMNDPKRALREIDMTYALDVFIGNIEDEKSLSYIKSDILVIHDGRLKMSHNQKEVLLAQLWDSAPIVIYEWIGDQQSFNVRCQLDEMQRKEATIVGYSNTINTKVSRNNQSDLF